MPAEGSSTSERAPAGEGPANPSREVGPDSSGRWPVPWQAVHGDRNGVVAWVQYALARGSVGLLARMPEGVQQALAAGLAGVGTRFLRRSSDAARRFLGEAFGAGLEPGRREELVRAAWHHLFMIALRDARFDEKVLRGDDPLSHYRLNLCADLERVKRSGKGALVATGHFGAWEAFPALGPLIGFDTLYAVSRPPRNRPLSVFLQRTREERGVRLVHRHGAVRNVQRIVAAGGTVAMLLDQRARGRTVVAPFFGRPAHCERSIAVLVRRLRAPVIVAACYAGERPFQYEVEVPRVFWPDELADEPPEKILAAINGELERAILARPEQYLWLHDRYRGAPARDEATTSGPASVA